MYKKKHLISNIPDTYIGYVQLRIHKKNVYGIILFYSILICKLWFRNICIINYLPTLTFLCLHSGQFHCTEDLHNESTFLYQVCNVSKAGSR